MDASNAGLTPLETTGKWGRIAWLPIPALAAAMLALWSADLRTAYESEVLLMAFNFLFSTLASLLVVILVARSFLTRPSPGLLLFGCGVLLWGAAGTIGPALLSQGINITITIHNSLVLLSAMCHLTGAVLSMKPRRSMNSELSFLFVAYTGALGAVWLVVMLSLDGWMPVFFVQGQGGTPIREVVLGLAALMFICTAGLLWLANRRGLSSFVRWYGLALLLVATGYFGIMIESVHGSLLSWTGRIAQFLGGAYMLVAALASVRESGLHGISLSEALRESQARMVAFAAATFEGIVESKDGRIVDCNEQLARMLGYSVDEMKGMEIAKFVAPEDLDRVQANIKQGEDSVIEHAAFRKDGTRIVVEAHGRPLSFDDARRFTAIRDITKRKQIQEALQESEERYRYLVESSNSIIMRADRNLDITYMNEFGLKFFGYTAEEIIGKNVVGTTIPEMDDEGHDLAAMAKDISRHPEQYQNNIHKNMRKNGELVWISWTNRIKLDRDGNFAEILAIGNDISLLKRAEEALKENEERFRAAFESGAVPMSLTRLDGALIKVNAAFCQMMGYSEAELSKLTFYDFTLPDDMNVNRAGVQQLLDGAQDSFRMEKRYIRKDGSIIWGDMSAAIVRDADGNPLYMVTHVQDITERKHAEKSLRESEREKAMILDNANEIIAYHDTAHNIQWANNAYLKSVGLSLAEVQGRKCYQAWGLDRLCADCPVSKVLDTGNSESGELTPQNQPHWPSDQGSWMVRAAPVRDDGGHIIGVIEVAYDITERKRVEEEISRNRKTFFELVERAPFGIYIIDSEFRIAHMNINSQNGAFRNVRPIVGRDLNEAMRILWPEAVAAEIIAKFRHTLETGEPYYSSRFIKPRHDLETVEAYEWELHRMMLPDGQYGVICYYFDSTRLRKAELSLQRRTLDLEIANKELESFIYSVSHDLRAPLRAISGFSDILVANASDRLTPKEKDYLVRIHGGTARMSQLIDDLLDLSRISQTAIKRREIDLSSMASEIVAGLRSAESDRNVEVNIYKRIIAHADPGMMEAALSNLLENAWKFSSKTEAASIEFGTIQQDGKTIYYIRDNGAGFDPAYSDKMFLPFHRLHTKDEFEGTGIGLAIVARIIQRHGGSIWAKGETGKGATIFFTLQ